MKPNKTIPLSLILNSRGRYERTRQYRMIDTKEFTDKPGAYVIRYKNYNISRFVGSSPIIKIGSASKGLKNRFDNYNHQKDITAEGTNLVDFLFRSQKTNVRLMHFLAHHKHKDSIVVDIYYNRKTKDSKSIELELIKDYLELHKELPPLNFGMK